MVSGFHKKPPRGRHLPDENNSGGDGVNHKGEARKSHDENPDAHHATCQGTKCYTNTRER